jgi:hypothetical protein
LRGFKAAAPKLGWPISPSPACQSKFLFAL